MDPETYRVEDGDDGASIAAKFGFASFEPIWADAANEALRAARPRSSQLYPGDTLVIPPRTQAFRAAAEKKKTVFRARIPRRSLWTVLRSPDGAAMADVPYELRYELRGAEVTDKGRSDAEGAIRCELPASVARVSLTAGAACFEVRLGGLNPIAATPDAGHSGIAQRLAALGYPCQEGAHDAAALAPAIRAFQLHEGLPETGELSDEVVTALARAYGQ
jgi:hypothetical protein